VEDYLVLIALMGSLEASRSRTMAVASQFAQAAASYQVAALGPGKTVRESTTSFWLFSPARTCLFFLADLIVSRDILCLSPSIGQLGPGACQLS